MIYRSHHTDYMNTAILYTSIISSVIIPSAAFDGLYYWEGVIYSLRPASGEPEQMQTCHTNDAPQPMGAKRLQERKKKSQINPYSTRP